MSLATPTTRTRAVVGGGLAAVLLLAAGVAIWARPGQNGTAATATKAAASDVAASPSEVAAASPGAAATEPTTTVVSPAATPTTQATTATTAPRPTSRATTPTTAAKSVPAPPAPATTQPAPVTPKFAPGQRINPTTAQVRAAITTLHQRIPLFEPTEAQFRTFADAACTSFDQGQTFSQVQGTVRQAVTYIQGASLTPADAEFAVRTVVQLRCPGYLP